jgi:hypothetical protein
MKASQEIKRWKNRMRKYYGKPNGVVKSRFLENPHMERKAASAAAWNRRAPQPNGGTDDR